MRRPGGRAEGRPEGGTDESALEWSTPLLMSVVGLSCELPKPPPPDTCNKTSDGVLPALPATP